VTSASHAPAPLPDLLAITPGRATDAAQQEALVRLVGALGAACGARLGLVLREPALADGPYLELARRCRPRVAWLALHDRPHLVGAVAADAVQLGFRSLRPSEARGVLRRAQAAAARVGFSGHQHDPLADLAPCDFSTFGPVFATPSKEGVLAPTGLAALRERCAAAPHPVYALGGVTAERAAACAAAGARGVAAIGAIFAADAPVAAALGVLAALPSRGGHNT